MLLETRKEKSTDLLLIYDRIDAVARRRFIGFVRLG